MALKTNVSQPNFEIIHSQQKSKTRLRLSGSKNEMVLGMDEFYRKQRAKGFADRKMKGEAENILHNTVADICDFH